MNDPQLPTSADDIAARVLDLITHAHGADDLAPAAIERATGIRIAYDREDPRIYGFGAHMDDATWCYNLISLPERWEGDVSKRMVFSFDDQSGQSQPPPVGQLDYDAYARILSDSGYVGALRLGARNAFHGVTFTRGDVSVEIDVRGSDADPQHLRVSSLVIDAKEPRHE